MLETDSSELTRMDFELLKVFAQLRGIEVTSRSVGIEEQSCWVII